MVVFISYVGSSFCGQGCISISFAEIDRWLKGQSFTSAELFIFHQNPSTSTVTSQQLVRYELYTVTRHGRRHHRVASFNVSRHANPQQEGWRVVDITHKLITHMRRRSVQLGELRLIVQRFTGLDMIGKRYEAPDNAWPILMVSRPMSNSSIATRSRSRRSLMPSAQCNSDSPCCLKSVPSEQSRLRMPWLTPITYNFYYCAGTCGRGSTVPRNFLLHEVIILSCSFLIISYSST